MNKTITLADLAAMLQARLVGGDPQRRVTGIAPMREAGPNELCFLAVDKYRRLLTDTQAAAVLVGEQLKDCPVAQLVVDNVNSALITVLRFFEPPLKTLSGIDPTASIDPTARLDTTASIGAKAVIGPDVIIGPDTVIGPGCVIGQETTIGARCRLDANVVVYHRCRIGNDCIIQANATIGSTGFGYATIEGCHHLIPHNGGVVLEDHVEIGANTCVDRAKFGDTRIGAGTKIDNLVQIAHNVQIGKACLLAGMTGLAGSAELGDNVTLAGRVSVADHVVIGNWTIAGGGTGFIVDVGPNQKTLGIPARDIRAELKSMALYQKLPDIVKAMKNLEKKVERLEAAKNHQNRSQTGR